MCRETPPKPSSLEPSNNPPSDQETGETSPKRTEDTCNSKTESTDNDEPGTPTTSSDLIRDDTNTSNTSSSNSSSSSDEDNQEPPPLSNPNPFIWHHPFNSNTGPSGSIHLLNSGSTTFLPISRVAPFNFIGLRRGGFSNVPPPRKRRMIVEIDYQTGNPIYSVWPIEDNTNTSWAHQQGYQWWNHQQDDYQGNEGYHQNDQNDHPEDSYNDQDNNHDLGPDENTNTSQHPQIQDDDMSDVNRSDVNRSDVNMINGSVNLSHRRTEYSDCDEDETRDILKMFRKEQITIEDLINWGEIYHTRRKRMCMDIDLRTLYLLTKPLKQLQRMIGLEKIKKDIVANTLMCLQNLDTSVEAHDSVMYHTVLYGPPGVGKTHIAKIIAHTYITMGLIRNKNLVAPESDHFNIDHHFKSVGRADLIGKFLGQTAPKTQEVIDDCRQNGKILFIDEVYSLGNTEGRDSFSKECIDTINKNLTEGARDFICIIAGYPEDIKTCFFSVNKGLERRFNIRYTLEGYSPEEMHQIFLQKLENTKWELKDPEIVPMDFFKKNKDLFPNYGGDIVTMIQKCKIEHAKRVFSYSREEKMKLSKEDIEKGMLAYQKDREDPEDKEEKERWEHIRNTLYS